MKTKLTLFFVAILLGLSLVQCISNEEKALKLINEQMFKTLFDFESYQPVETRIDSAFHTPYNDSINLRYAVFCSVARDRFDDYLEKAENARNAVEIWADSYSSYGRQKLQDAYNEGTTALTSASLMINMIELYYDSIKMRSSEFDKDFIGWQVTHKFRCKTKGGYSDLSTKVYIMDNKFTQIIDEIDVDDKEYKEYQSIIKDALKQDSKTDDNNLKE